MRGTPTHGPPYTYSDRKKLADAMWSVALADGDRDPDEEQALQAIESALGLSDEDIAAARRAALGGD